MSQSIFQKDVICIEDFSKQDILNVLEKAKKFEANAENDLLKGSLLGSCFFEPSTRTRLSFESAIHRLGGSVVGFSEESVTATQKGESLCDTIKMLDNYVDVIVIRHGCEGAAQLAADVATVPVINAGDGANEHPTQTLVDLHAIQETQGTLEGLSIAFIGDLKYGRAAHSLAKALIHFPARLYFVCPQLLEMPKEICSLLREKRIKFSFHRSVDEVIHKVDVMYMTRVQKERFGARSECEEFKNLYQLKSGDLEVAKETMKVLHPLPRNFEIDKSVDQTKHEAYFSVQAKKALYVRQALLSMVLGK